MNEDARLGAATHDDKYEETVLEFLDKEIAAAQPIQTQGEHSDDLEALVSDLMKQVITESYDVQEQPRSVQQDLNKLISDLLPQQATARADSTSVPELPRKPEPGRAAAVPKIFADSSPFTHRRVPLIVGATLCLIASVGVVIHYSAKPSIMRTVASAPQAPAPLPASVKPGSPAPAPTSAGVAIGREELVSVQVPAAASKAPSPETKTAAKQPGPASTLSQAPLAIVPTAASEPKTAADKPSVAAAAAAPVSAPPTPASVAEKPAPSGPPEPPAPAPAPAAPAAERAVAQPALPPPVAVEPKPVPAAASLPSHAVAAVPISQVSPTYPAIALKNHLSGQVVLDLQIDAQGRVVKAAPVSGPVLLQAAAAAAAMKWRYKPASVNGNEVPSQSRVTIVFNMNK